jgi:hypothetical protein
MEILIIIMLIPLALTLGCLLIRALLNPTVLLVLGFAVAGLLLLAVH